MIESEGRSDLPQKLLARGTIKIRIALASGLALTVGAWLAPRAAPTTNLTTPQEHAAPLLEEQVQLREAGRTFVGVQDVAVQAKDHSVAVLMPTVPAVASRNDYSEPASTARRAAGFGVLVSDALVLTHSLALDGRSAVELSFGAGVTKPARVVAYEPPTGLVLLQTEPSTKTPVTLATQAPAAGALAVAVGRSEGRDVAVPVFVTGVGGGRYTIGGINESILPGMPVFNLAGELFAIAAPDEREMRAIPVKEATDRLMARVASGERRSSFGVGFQGLGGPLTRTFGEEGVVITEVLEGGPADLADLQVGDVLLAVGDVQLDSADTATRALNSAPIGAATTVRVRRAGRTSDIDVTPALAYEVAALARARPDSSTGPEARGLFPAAVLEGSTIPLSARVLRVNGRTVTSRAQVQRELRLARNPVPVLLHHGSDRFFVVIEPTR